MLLCILLDACAPWPEPAAASADIANAAVGAKVARFARAEVGVPYLYGGDTPAGFDCSGLVYYVYGQAGVTVPRTAEGQYGTSLRVARDALQPGDLLFFRGDNGSLLHVGVYIGSGWFVHAPETGKSVSGARLDSDYWVSHYLGAGRPPERP